MRVLPLIIFSAFISACGSSGSDDSSPTQTQESNDGNSYDIISLTVSGSDGDSTSPATIDPAINNGEFVVTSEVRNGEDIYHGELFLSTNTTLGANDISLAAGTCDPTDNECASGINNDECTFDNSNTITCSGASTDISDFLDEIPKSAYLILEVCDASTLNCDNASASVTFQ